MRSWYQWSRPSVIGISESSPDAPVRCTTTTSVIDGASASATSTVGLSSAAWPRRHGQLGDHRHVDGDPVALLDAEAPEGVGEALHLGQEVGVGDRPGVAGLALPVEGDLVAPPRVDVAVEAVLRDVERAADEPLRE